MITHLKALGAALSVFALTALLGVCVALTTSAAFADASPPASVPSESPAVLDATSAITAHAPAPAPLAPVAPASPEAAGDLLSTLGAPAWAVTALSIFATVSLAYQALIAFAHKRAAETADVADDKWIASLEAQAWFRILDKIFYWGGYLGAKIGHRKL